MGDFVQVRVPRELAERVDGVRGDAPRERWVRRAIEAALAGGGSGASTGAGDAASSGGQRSGVDGFPRVDRVPAAGPDRAAAFRRMAR